MYKSYNVLCMCGSGGSNSLTSLTSVSAIYRHRPLIYESDVRDVRAVNRRCFGGTDFNFILVLLTKNMRINIFDLNEL